MRNERKVENAESEKSNILVRFFNDLCGIFSSYKLVAETWDCEKLS